MAGVPELVIILLTAGTVSFTGIGHSEPDYSGVSKQLNSTGRLGLPTLEANCKWTGCEGKMKFGQDLCNWYGAGRYTGRTNYEQCDWDTSRVECCLPLPAGTTKWTNTCYGTAYGSNWACQSEFGPEFHGTGSKSDQGCSGWYTYRHECKNF